MPFRRTNLLAISVGLLMALSNPCALAQTSGDNVLPITQMQPQPDSDPAEKPTRQKDQDNPKERQRTSPATVVSAGEAFISGTVTTSNGAIVPGAKILLHNLNSNERRSTVAGETGGFQFGGLEPGSPYRLTVEAVGLEIWKSEDIRLEPGQNFILSDIRMKFPELVTTVTVYGSRERIAAEQVLVQEKQRVFGFIPNFYVTYDLNPVPLTTKLKFKLAFKADTDAMTFVGVGFMAGIYQAGDMLDYGQGAEGFAKRVGAGYADASSDIFMGGAILPWLFRQDPRYFYQGTGTKRARALHALASAFVCKGDNGKRQPNYSSLGGDLASGAISNLYYPKSNRGPGIVLQGFSITTGVRAINALLQEFVFRNLTPSARARY